MILLVLFAGISIAFSFLCSVLEAVLLSITPSYLQRQINDNPPLGATLKGFKDDIDRPLSAILTLNTIAHTVGAIGVGAIAGDLWGEQAISIFGMQLSYVSLVATIMTLAILIASEIIPKTLGANYWKSLAPITARILKVIMWILAPFVFISQLITKKLKKEKGKSVLSRADFTALTQVAAEGGELDTHETAIINNLLQLKDQAVNEIMTPRTVILMCDKETLIQDFYREHDPITFSRIPVYEGSTDNVIGFMLKDELLAHLADGKESLKASDIVNPITEVRRDKKILNLYLQMIKANVHMSVVRDMYGSLVGLVTLEDVVETLLGAEIVDEFDTHPDMQQLAKQRLSQKK